VSSVTSRTIPDGAPDGAPLLHFESYVFDFSPLGEPIIMTPRAERAMVEALERGGGPEAGLRAIAQTRNRELETDPSVREQVLRAWRASGVNGVQVTLGGLGLAHTWDDVLRDIAHYHRRVRAGGDMAICVTAGELLAAAAHDKVGLLFGLQDAAPIGDDLGRLDLLYDAGVRVLQLTFNLRNLVGDGCVEREQAGLSRFGVEVVKRLNELGIIVDVSHSGSKTTLDAIEHSERPIAITHSSCMAVAEHPRAKTDEQLRALAERDGYLGINAVPFFIAAPGEQATVDTVADHVEHAVGILGVERVGIGTDWAVWSPDYPRAIQQKTREKLALGNGFNEAQIPPWGDGTIVGGFESWESWPNITAALLDRGFSDDEVKGLIGGNWLAFMRRFGL
jgi:membrane dipeptidase